MGICIFGPGDELDEYDLIALGFSFGEIERLLAQRYYHRAHREHAEFTPTRRIEFAKYLVTKGLLTDGHDL